MRTAHRITIIIAAFLVVADFPAYAFAAPGVPKILNYQGRLMDSSGTLLGGAGTQFCFKFSLYDDPAVGNGSKVWPTGSPSTMTISVRSGVFNAGVGDVSQGGDTLDFNFQDNDTVYLNVEVASKVGATCAPGDGAESFETLSPRQRIMASGFAINASTLAGFSASQAATGNQIPVLNSGNLVLGGQIFSAGFSSYTNILVGGVSTTTIQGSTSGTSTIQGFINVAGVNSTSTFSGSVRVASNLEVSGTASTSNLTVSTGFTFGTVSGVLKAVAGAVAAALVDLASDVTGILGVSNGGTGWANVASGAILFGNGSSALATTTQGVGGQVLAYLNGVPTWTATTSFSYPLLYTGTSVSLAFGTTTSNTWGGTQTFANVVAGTDTVGTLSATSSAIFASSTAQGRFIAGNIIATSSATSTFEGPLMVGNQATSSFAVSIVGSTTAATSQTGTGIVSISNTSRFLSSGTNVMRLNVGVPVGTSCTSGTTCPRFLEYFAGIGPDQDRGGTGVGSVRLSAAGTGITQTSGAADFAEFMQLNSAASAGDIVSLNPSGQYQRAVAGQSLIGVISENPAWVGNANLEGTANAYIVGFAGVVPTTVSVDRGPIAAGDLITAGDTAGVGVKLVSSGYAVGQALESFSGPGQGSIDVLVFPKYVDAAVALNSYGGSGGGVSGYWSLSTTTGVVSLASSTYTTASTSNLVVSSGFTLGRVSGILKAVAGVVSNALVDLATDVTGILGVGSGGTGTSTTPTYGKVLVGNAAGGYDLLATSSLGIVSAVNDGAFSTTSADYYVGSSSTIPKTFSANIFSAIQTFSQGVTADSLSVTGSATSTFANGIQLSGGCFRDTSGQCITGSGGGGGSGVLLNIEVFSTPGTTTYIATAGATNAEVVVIGGGGGGGGATGAAADATEESVGGGGGAGGTAVYMLDLTSSSTVMVVVGSGGSAGTSAGTDGGGGGTSRFGSFATSTGGNSGTGSTNTGGTANCGADNAFGAPGPGGTSVGGDINIPGNAGTVAACAAEFTNGGNGGASYVSGGGAGGQDPNSNVSVAGGNGTFGSGGGGAACEDCANTGAAGGQGGAGVVIIYEYGPFTGIMQVGNGGTGIGDTPTFGQLLMGNSVGGYALTSTSSLGFFGTQNAWTVLQTFSGGASSTNVSASGTIFSGTASTSNLIVSGSATSTFGNGINLSTGCFAIAGTCIGAGGGGTWGSITGTLSNQTDLQAALDAKMPIASWYATTTDALDEGTTNLYYTNNRVASVIAATTTDALAEGVSRLYFTNSRVQTYLDSLAKGYYFSTTSAAYWDSVQFRWGTTSASYFLSQNQGNAFSTSSANAFLRATTSISSLLSAPSLASVATSLTGVLRATAGALSTALIDLTSDITGILGISNGGTGTSSAPTYGKLLVGNAVGGYDLRATSTLGINLTDTTGVLGITSGGTGISAYTKGDILYSPNDGQLAVLPVGGTGQVLKVTGGVPQWGADLTSGGGGGGGGFFSTTTNDLIIYPSDTSKIVAIGTNATSSTNQSIFEVSGKSYFSNNVGIATTSAGTIFSIGGVANFATGGSTFYTPLTLMQTSATGLSVSGDTSLTRATTTSLAITNVSNALLSTNGDGSVFATSIDSSLSFAANLLSLNTGNANAWSALQTFQNGFIAQASSTVAGAFTVSGDASLQKATTTALAIGNVASAIVATNNSGSAIAASIAPSLNFGSNTLSLNTGNANSWTALQSFMNGATTTILSVFSKVFIGGSATTTLQGEPTGTSTIQGFLNVAGVNSTSTFSGNLSVQNLNVGGGATSTFARGINLAAGCFAVSGTCVGAGGGISLGDQNTWTALQLFQGGVLSQASSTFVGQFNASQASTSQITVSGRTSLAEATSTTFFANVGHFTDGLIDSMSAAVASITNLTASNATITNATTTNLAITGISDGLIAANANGSIIEALVDSSLSFSSNTIALDLSNPNIWTGLQRFGNASTTNLSVFNKLYVGGGATTTIQGEATGTSTIQGFLDITGTNSTSTISGHVFVGGRLQVTGQFSNTSSATSSFSNGINISGGCFAVNGTCITLGGTYIVLSKITQIQASTTWSKPTDLSHVVVEVWGAGGGSGGADSSATTVQTGGGGGGGGYGMKLIEAQHLGGTVTVDVGAGGSAGATAGGNGGPGGGSGFRGHVGATGGGGGTGSGSANATVNTSPGGAGGVGLGGDINLSGDDGDAGRDCSATGTCPGYGGSGGDAPRGGSGAQAGSVSAGDVVAVQGDAPGGGASGAVRNDTTGQAGAAGGAGGVVVYEYTSTTTITGADLAENYPVDNPTIGAGDIVAFDTGMPVTVTRATRRSERPIAGVISTAPGIVLGDKEGIGQRPVALSGRVPVKFSSENGDVSIGDRITVSPSAGVGMRGGIFDDTVGIVIAPVQHDESGDTVMIFLDLQRGADPNDIAMNLLGNDASVFSFMHEGESASSTPEHGDGILDFVGGMMSAIGKRISVFGESQSATSTQSASSTVPVEDSFAHALVRGITDAVVRLFASASNGIGEIFAGSFRAKNEICVDDQCLTKDDVSTILKIAKEQTSQSAAAAGSTEPATDATASSTPSGASATSSEEIAPIIKITGNNPATIYVNEVYGDLGAVITGPDGALNLGIDFLVDGETADHVSIDTSVPGDHEIVYRAIDENGLVGTAIRIVQVIEPTTQDIATSTPNIDDSETAVQESKTTQQQESASESGEEPDEVASADGQVSEQTTP